MSPEVPPSIRSGGLRGLGRSLWQRLKPAARALRHRNYKLFFFGQGMSLVGTWMQRTALAWLVYRLTGSPVLLGVVGFSSQIATFLVAPFAGVLADRASRRGLLVATQILAMLQAFALAVLTIAGWVQVWHIILLSIMLGLVNAFDIPIRHSFVVEMLESRKDLPKAIALNSFLVNGARVVGPPMGGVLIATVGEGLCFLLNGVTFVAVIAALLAMRLGPPHARAAHPNVLRNLGEGFHYAFSFLPIRAILLLLATVSLLGLPYNVLIPIFAKDVLGGGSVTQGVLFAAVGLGAMGGALLLAARESVRGLGRVVALAGGVFGAALIGFAYSRNLFLSLCLLVIAGFGMMIQLSSSNSLLQTIVDDDKRGRVMSFYVMSFMGMMPFGSLLAGWLAKVAGAPTAVMVGGTGCIVGAIVFASALPRLGKLVHPTYIRLGIVPSPANNGNGQPVGVTSPWEFRL